MITKEMMSLIVLLIKNRQSIRYVVFKAVSNLEAKSTLSARLIK